MNRLGAVAVLAAVVAFDQAVKLLVASQLPLGTSIAIIPGVLDLTYVRNPGIAFSMINRMPLTVPAAIALMLLYLLFKNGTRWSTDRRLQPALALLCGGAVGNLADRVRVGAVIDYIDLHVWPVFNLADVAVVAGAGLLFLSLVLRPSPRPLDRTPFDRAQGRRGRLRPGQAFRQGSPRPGSGQAGQAGHGGSLRHPRGDR